MSNHQDSPRRISSKLTSLIAFVGLIFATALLVRAETYAILYSFQGATNGRGPYADLLGDQNGNLYGTTAFGGTFAGGTVFKISSEGKGTVLYSFAGITGDGNAPLAGLIRDQAGNFYGTTSSGGINQVGTVFKLDSHNKETVLITFNPSADGSSTFGALTPDAQGNLYGTTYYPGLYSNSMQGSGPLRDSSGTLYGTAYAGGFHNRGVVYKITSP